MKSKWNRASELRAGAGLALVLVLVAAGCAPEPAPEPVEPPDTRPADEAAIRGLVEGWSAAAEAKDAEEFASFYAEDGVLMIESAPDLEGRAAILEGIGGMMEDPNFALSFATDDVVVARAGDIAYETGTYSLTMTGENGEPSTLGGSYLVVWEKQADGAWKVLYDVPVSDPPAPPVSAEPE